MLKNGSSRNIAKRKQSAIVRSELDNLHTLCGIYTQDKVAERILDAIGWTARNDLTEAVLLEPSIGDGAFLVPAARRLLKSLHRLKVPLTLENLRPRLVGFEILPREAKRARTKLQEVLRHFGVSAHTARTCAQAWVRNSDFLLARLPEGSVSHVAGNPPYVRWRRVPPGLRARYEKHLDPQLRGGDLYIPFLHFSFNALAVGGRCGILVSSRWKFSGTAERLRNEWLPRLDVSSDTALSATDAFTTRVGAYPSILVATKRGTPRTDVQPRRRSGKKTLEELGCTIRVGPALGHTPAFVLGENEADVEPSLLARWMDGKDIHRGSTRWRKRRIVVMHDKAGQLVDLTRYPRLRRRLDRFRSQLKDRYVVAHGEQWYSSIDRIRRADWERPKILVPELARVPRCAVDRTGAIPAHGVYAIFVDDDDVTSVFERLRDGKLARALRGVAPVVAGGYVRAYRRFLSQIRI